MPDQKLTKLKTLTNQSDAASAVRCATIEYMRFARRRRLKELTGRVQMDDNWAALEELETMEQQGR